MKRGGKVQKCISSKDVLEKVGKVIAPLPSQSEYMKELAGILAMHINRNVLIDQGYRPDELPVPSAIVVAPTGQGKTFLLKKMAECMDINIINVDCSTLVGESYKGVSLSQRLAGAMAEAKNEKTFQRSVIFFDEVDKLCNGGSGASSGMTSLLQLFNGGSVALNKDDRASQSIDVSRFAIMMGGAFVGLDEIVRERVNPKVKIGFNVEETKKITDGNWMEYVTARDLCKFGLMMELVGRVGTILTLKPLGLEDYRQLLNAETGSLKNRYDNFLYGLYGVHLLISEEGVEYLAQVCMQSTATGARAVEPILAGLAREAITQVECDDTICKVIVDADGEHSYVRYERGGRKCEARADAVTSAGSTVTHIVRAKNTKNLVDKLCRYYRNACGDTGVEEQWRAFLGCAVEHLHKGAREEEFTLESLEKLAAVTHRNGGSSTFERILRRSFGISRNDMEKLNAVYSDWMCRNLVSACRSVKGYLFEKHGACEIHFEIRVKK